LSATIGEDGYTLLASLDQAATQPEWAWLKDLPAVRILEQTWAQQYRQFNGLAQRLTPKEMAPVSAWYRSPYDPEVRYGRKRDFDWIGYKVHLTECCDDDLPHLITQVQTTPATQQDHHALKAIHAELVEKHLLPQEHLVDAGYISAKRIVESRDIHDVDLIGPVHVDPSWQAHTPGAFDISQFAVDWEHHTVTCPQDKHSIAWHHSKDAKGESIVTIWFAQSTCQACPLRVRCTKAQATGRSMTLRFRPNATRCSWPLGPVSRRQSSVRCIRRDVESKAPLRRPLAIRACATPAISGNARRISSISSRLWRPIFSASCAGSRAPHSPRHVPHALRLSLPSSQFANSIELTLVKIRASRSTGSPAVRRRLTMRTCGSRADAIAPAMCG
jgi:hypothetical protein